MSEDEQVAQLGQVFASMRPAMQAWIQLATDALDEISRNIAAWYEENQEKVDEACHTLGRPDLIDALQRIRSRALLDSGDGEK